MVSRLILSARDGTDAFPGFMQRITSTLFATVAIASSALAQGGTGPGGGMPGEIPGGDPPIIDVQHIVDAQGAADSLVAHLLPFVVAAIAISIGVFVTVLGVSMILAMITGKDNLGTRLALSGGVYAKSHSGQPGTDSQRGKRAGFQRGGRPEHPRQYRGGMRRRNR